MKDWIPAPGSAKGRLAVAALREFGARGFEAVSVSDLAAKAGVTTGSLYHHFDGKPGLYRFAREEAERRMLDRMHGAAAAAPPGESLHAALLVAFDTAVEQGLVALLAEPPGTAEPPAGGEPGTIDPPGDGDPIARFLAPLLPAQAGAVAARVVAAGWRAALGAVAEGVPGEQARTSLTMFRTASAATR